MSAQATLEAKGLWTNVNTASGIPPGGTTKQMNMFCHKPGLMAPRRGRNKLSTTGMVRIFDFGVLLLGFGADGMMYYSSDYGINWTSLVDWVQSSSSVFPAYPDKHYYGYGLNEAFYFTTTEGVKVLSDTSVGHRPAGVPYGLNAKVTLVTTPGVAMLPNSRVGYRIVFGYRDSNGQVNLGAPSQRAIAINTDVVNGANPTIEAVIPPGVHPGKHFWQLYRTYPSPDAAVDPGDEMSLVYEGEIPASSQTIELSRTNSIATIKTIAPHGIVAGNSVNLGARYEVARNPGTISNIVSDIADNSGLPTANFFRFRVNADNSITVLGTIALGVAETVIGGYKPHRRWFHSETLNYDIFVHPDTKDVKVYQPETGAAVFATALGYNAIGAALSNDGTKVYVLCPNNAAPAFNYSMTTGARFGVVDLVLNTLTWLNTANMPAGLYSESDLFQPAFSRSPCFMTKDADGVESFVIASRVVDSIDVTKERINFYYTQDNGATWAVTYPYAGTVSTSESVLISGFMEAVQCQCDDGTVRAFVGGDYRVPSMFVGTTQTIFEFGINNDRMYSGFKVDNVQKTVGWLYANTAPSANRWQVAQCGGNWNFGSVSRQYVSTDVNVKRGSYGLTMSTFDNGQGFIHGLAINPATQTCWLIDRNNGTSTVLYNAAPTLGIGRTYRGFSNPNQIIFYEGSYVVIAAPTADTFTVRSVGPDFTTVSYVVTLNFNTVSVVDVVDPGAVGPSLYTSPSREGISQANFPPPRAKDAETFRSYGFYANVTLQASLTVNLFSVGVAATDLKVGDFVKVGNAWVEAAVAEDFANSKFKLTTGSGSAFENIRLTVQSLSECVNKYADSRHGCVTIKNEDTISPGCFIIRSLGFDDSVSFEVRRGSTTGALAMDAWSPAVPATATPTQAPNLLYYSKPGQGGAVPLLNAVKVGSDNKAILRIKATREVLFVFKEDGIFAMRGYAPPWQVDPFDLSNVLIFPDALCQLDNNIFAVTEHGLMRISDSGMELISLPTQDVIETYFSASNGQLQNAANNAFMFGDPSAHKLYLCLPSLEQSVYTQSARLMVYDTFTNTWAEQGWNGQPDYGPTSTNNALISFDKNVVHGLYCAAINNCIWVGDGITFSERRSYTTDDFADDEYLGYPITYLGTGGGRPGNTTPNSWHRFDINAGNLIGYALRLGGLCVAIMDYYYDAANDFYYLRLDRPLLVNGQYIAPGTEARVHYPVWCDVEYAPTYEVNIAALNHFREVSVAFKSAKFSVLRMVYKRPIEPSDTIDNDRSAVVVVDGNIDMNVNVDQMSQYQCRTLVPRNQQRCSVLTVGFQLPAAGAVCEVDGTVINYNPGPMRRRR